VVSIAQVWFSRNSVVVPKVKGHRSQTTSQGVYKNQGVPLPDRTGFKNKLVKSRREPRHFRSKGGRRRDRWSKGIVKCAMKKNHLLIGPCLCSERGASTADHTEANKIIQKKVANLGEILRRLLKGAGPPLNGRQKK